MNREKKVAIILEELDKYIQIDCNFEDIYRKAIRDALAKITMLEKEEISTK